jgi:hypothetical protein
VDNAIDTTDPAERERVAALVRERTRPIGINPSFVDLEPFDMAATIGSVPGLEGETKAHSDEIRGALRFFLGHRLATQPEPHLSRDLFDCVVPTVRSLLYWGELDRLRRDVKATTFHIVSRRVAAAMSHWEDTETASFHLRQAIEVTWWGLFCSYGAECARAQIAKLVAGKKAAYVDSPDVENFLRGWFAPDGDRIEAGRRAIGATSAYEHPSDFVDENATILKKQRFVSRFWASSVEGQFGVKLTTQLDCLADLYEYLCGWVHVTPLLVCDWFGGVDAVPKLPMASLIRVGGTAMWQLHRHLLFDARWNSGGFVSVVGPCLDPSATDHVRLGVTYLGQLRHARKPVEVELSDGTTLAPFPK